MLVTIPVTQPSSEAQQIDGWLLRNVCGLFLTGVTVITSGVDGRSDGTTVNSFTPASLDPPLVLLCLHNKSRLRPVVKESGLFVVNFLAGRQQRLAQAFAGEQTAAFHEAGHHRSVGGVPILSDAIAFLA